MNCYSVKINIKYKFVIQKLSNLITGFLVKSCPKTGRIVKTPMFRICRWFVFAAHTILCAAQPCIFNWKIINYANDALAIIDAIRLINGKILMPEVTGSTAFDTLLFWMCTKNWQPLVPICNWHFFNKRFFKSCNYIEKPSSERLEV
jgi:hypothetical protein